MVDASGDVALVGVSSADSFPSVVYAQQRTMELQAEVDYVGDLVRQLLERQLSEVGRRGVHPKVADVNQIKKNDLSSQENELYKKLDAALDELWRHSHDMTEAQVEYLAARDYGLGHFFRKMHPSRKYRPRAKKHWERAARNIPAYHKSRPMAEFWAATAWKQQGDFVVDRCPQQHVVELFNKFANEYDDAMLEHLSYAAPFQLRRMVNSTGCIPEGGFDKACDLGCGTGLSGLAFRDCTKVFTGVDMTPKILRKAEERKTYDMVELDEMDHFLDSALSNEYSLFLSLDVFVYVGDLAGTFSKVFKGLAPGGVFAFSTELLEESDGVAFRLHERARFAHTEKYILDLANQLGFTVLKNGTSKIRKERREPVMGMLYVLQKPSK